MALTYNPFEKDQAPESLVLRKNRVKVHQEPPPLPDSESVNKPTTELTTNLQQSSNKPTTELTTNLQQSSNKLTTELTTEGGKPNETYNKLPTELTTLSTTNLQQSSNKLTTESTFLTLVGLQKRIVLFIYNLCRQQGERTTEAISISNLAFACESTSRASQETIRRLEKKRYIKRKAFKNGRGGWTVYELPDTVYKELFYLETSNKLTTNLQQTPHKLPTELTTELTTTRSSSSSSSSVLDNKTTTTEELKVDDKNRLDLPPEWESVDFSDLSEIHFGRPQLKQWCDRKYCSAEQAQESIYHFAFYLKHAKKGDIKTGPLNFFMGIMAKQHYFPRPDGYLSPEEVASKQRAEDLKRKCENLKTIEQELYDYSFDIWFRSLTEDEIQILVPNIFNYEPRKSALRGVFLDKYWLKIKSNPNLDPGKLNKSERKEVSGSETIEQEELSSEEIRCIADQQFGALQAQGMGSS